MSRLARRPMANHIAAAAAMRAQPGTWVHVGVYRTTQSAQTTARWIRIGAERLPSYQPAGAYEPRIALVDDGAAVFARYVGTSSPSPRARYVHNQKKGGA